MGKIRLVLAVIALFASMLFYSPAYAAEGFEIEQVQADMPEVTIYLRDEKTPVKEALSIYLDDEELTITDIELFGATGQGTDYFVLVDVSNSMPAEYVKKIKVALNNLATGLNSYDQLVLITFGEDVTQLLTGTENVDERLNAIEQIHNKDNKTLLFEALKQTADLADGMENDNRKLVLVISDGEDFSVGVATNNEAVKALSERNIPMYAMGISAASKENLNQFGEVARSLGGTLSIFKPKETDITLSGLWELWNNVWVLKTSATNNYADNETHTVLVKNVTSGYMRSKDILLVNHQPDTEAPHILAVEKTGDKQITVSFSEKVVGANQVSAWNVSYAEENLALTTAVYADKEETEVILSFEKPFYTGEYVITAPGVYDDSMEENTVSDSFLVELEGMEPIAEEGEKASEKEEPVWKEWMQTWWWLIIVVLLCVVLVTGVVIFCIIKKNRGIVFVNGKATLASNVDTRQHIAIERENGLPITLELLGTVGTEKSKIHTQIVSSLIVGRSSGCDLSLDDEKLSRQHFVLEQKGDDVFITDLQTTNGTTVNGVAIHAAYKLSPRDIIAAGSLQMRITW